MTIFTRSSGTRSSSASSWASEVRMPWPTSTLPVYTVIESSAPMWSQAAI